jgi:excisionase family DNA binding protein
MNQLTFEQLPQAVGQLCDRLTTIEQLLLDSHKPQPASEDLLTIAQAAKFLNLSVPTIYSKVSRAEIPVNKRGKRLYFYRSELAEWIKGGRKRTNYEIREELKVQLASRRGNA